MSKKPPTLKKTHSLESTGSLLQANVSSRVSLASGYSLDVTDDQQADLYSCSMLLIRCVKHKVYALAETGRKGIFLPTVAILNDGHQTAARRKLRTMLKTASGTPIPYSEMDLMHFQRVQVPFVEDFVERATFKVDIGNQPTSKDCCRQVNPTSGLQWKSFKEIERMPELWGPEPAVFIEAFCEANNVEPGLLAESTLKGMRRFLHDSRKHVNESHLLAAASYTEPDVAKLYCDFLQHCWPSVYMNPFSFNQYMSELKFANLDNSKVLPNFYRSFINDETVPYLNFDDFLLGFAASDKATQHGGNAGEMRSKYIFKYFDSNNDKVLDKGELRSLVFDKLKAADKGNKPPPTAKVNEELSEIYKKLNIASGQPLTFEHLKTGIGNLTIRGTSSLYRSNISLKKTDKLVYPPITDTFSVNGTGQVNTSRCTSCAKKQYHIASHSYTLTKNGQMSNPIELDNDDVKKVSRDLRRESAQYFKSNIMNICLDLIKEYADHQKILTGLVTKKSSNYLKHKDKLDSVIENFHEILVRVQKIFEGEKKVLQVGAPCTVFGDIHGNLHDLLKYEQLMWRDGMQMNAGQFLFLGDYVDRGQNSVECVMYLFCQKILTPHKIYLLRGNHEVRSTNRNFTFYRELEEKFGPKHVERLWERFNEVFDVMPICAIIDGSVFCAHGGIPTTVQLVSELNIPTKLSDPENQYPPAWEMLWNDPVDDKAHETFMELARSHPNSEAALAQCPPGYSFNTKRGTAFYFSDEALKVFLKRNGLSHLIRAHEVCQDGYTIHKPGNSMTVFSSSKYSQQLNHGGAILVDQEKLRPMRFRFEDL